MNKYPDLIKTVATKLGLNAGDEDYLNLLGLLAEYVEADTVLSIKELVDGSVHWEGDELMVRQKELETDLEERYAKNIQGIWKAIEDTHI